MNCGRRGSVITKSQLQYELLNYVLLINQIAFCVIPIGNYYTPNLWLTDSQNQYILFTKQEAVCYLKEQRL